MMVNNGFMLIGKPADSGYMLVPKTETGRENSVAYPGVGESLCAAKAYNWSEFLCLGVRIIHQVSRL